MSQSLNRLLKLFPTLKSADHPAVNWNADAYRLDDAADRSLGMDRYPAMLVDSDNNVALAEWNWISVPAWTAAAGHAYMLSTRRI